MGSSNQVKGKRALTLFLGFNNGLPAYGAGGVLQPGATEFEVSRQVGDWTKDQPGETDVDPLDRGEFMTDSAPILDDDQGQTGSFTCYYTEETDPAIVVLLDILNEDGAAAALPSVISNSERKYCDMKRVFTHPNNPADTHGEVLQQCRLTHGVNTATPVQIPVNYKSREVRSSIRW